MDANITNNVKPWLWQALAVLLGLFLLLLVADKFYSLYQNIRPAVPKNTVSMSAEGRVSATPDLATITVGVTSNGNTAKAVQDDMAKKVNQIIDFVKKQGIDPKDITTSNFSVYPNYDYQRGTNEITGYQGNETVTVKIRGVDKSTEKVSIILDGATASGGNQIQGVYFSFEDPDNLRQEARKQAIAKARQKAQELADEVGLKLGKIVSISDNTGSYPVPMPYAAEGLGGGGGAKSAPDIEAGSQDISASVTITFEIK